MENIKNILYRIEYTLLQQRDKQTNRRYAGAKRKTETKKPQQGKTIVKVSILLHKNITENFPRNQKMN